MSLLIEADLPNALDAKLCDIAKALSVRPQDLLQQPTLNCLRVNRKHPQHLRVLDFIYSHRLQPLDWRHVKLADTYWIARDIKAELTHNSHFELGSYYLLDSASLLAALAVGANPGEEILDMAAAPGGKTLILAQQMASQGRLAAIEVSKSRYFKLCHQLKQQHQDFVRCYLMDARQVGKKCPARFDRILLDAPCSAEARINLNQPKSWAHWSNAKVKSSAKKQKQLIKAAINALKIGGTLTYATCTLSVEENEAVIAYALKYFSGKLVLKPVLDPEFEQQLAASDFGPRLHPGLTQWAGKSFDPSLALSRRCLPAPGSAAFFVCCLVKQG